MKMTITVQQAASLLGMAALTIRAYLIYGKLRLQDGTPVGEAIKMKGKKHYDYFISAPKFAQYMGISEESLWERINNLS